ncbi:ankyrin repeat and SOCS box protein 9-like isoform X3 [Polypterus senegalus]|uniref:ankyrin repeat and SOCS box protein 9-like isoform X3 n=1 Tax=Polypterus senegalus TaxID=55291 RepID=UPI00196432DA|nr:ankyrin repeat and SOCS box protein 9-like isoform X3 [Polypterus senegalus]
MEAPEVGSYFSNSFFGDESSDWSPVHDAASHGRLLALRKLIAQVNTTSIDWNTPLYNACVSGSTTCIDVLLENGATAQAESELASPLHAVAQKGHTACIEPLTQHGADIDYNIKHLGTPLYAASAKQHLETTRKLLELGANVNTGKEQDTPLHAAARSFNSDLVQLLLDHGANVRARNAEGKCPLELAAPGSDVRRLLLQREGPPTLMKLCRLSIRKYLGRSRLKEIFQLDIPSELKCFLMYR